MSRRKESPLTATMIFHHFHFLFIHLLFFPCFSSPAASCIFCNRIKCPGPLVTSDLLFRNTLENILCCTLLSLCFRFSLASNIVFRKKKQNFTSNFLFIQKIPIVTIRTRKSNTHKIELFPTSLFFSWGPKQSCPNWFLYFSYTFDCNVSFSIFPLFAITF